VNRPRVCSECAGRSPPPPERARVRPMPWERLGFGRFRTIGPHPAAARPPLPSCRKRQAGRGDFRTDLLLTKQLLQVTQTLLATSKILVLVVLVVVRFDGQHALIARLGQRNDPPGCRPTPCRPARRRRVTIPRPDVPAGVDVLSCALPRCKAPGAGRPPPGSSIIRKRVPVSESPASESEPTRSRISRTPATGSRCGSRSPGRRRNSRAIFTASREHPHDGFDCGPVAAR